MINLVVFDWKRTLYGPDTKELIKGALNLLEFIRSKNISMVLVGKGGDDMRGEVERLKVKQYFRKIVFAEGEKDPNIFIPHVSKDDPKMTVFIGDRVRSELEIGKRLGATTIWIKQGKFADEKPENQEQEPDYTVSNLSQCQLLLKSILF